MHVAQTQDDLKLYREAQDGYETLLSHYSVLVGPLSPECLDLGYKIATVELNRGNEAVAESQYLDVLEGYSALYGPSHSSVGRTLTALAGNTMTLSHIP